MNSVNIIQRYWYEVEFKLKKLLEDQRCSIVSIHIIHLARLKSGWDCIIVTCPFEKELIN
jgi:hypothetical protein